jgi:hypothetical protein
VTWTARPKYTKTFRRNLLPKGYYFSLVSETFLLGPHMNCPNSRLSHSFQDITWNQAKPASFYVLSNKLFTKKPHIRRPEYYAQPTLSLTLKIKQRTRSILADSAPARTLPGVATNHISCTTKTCSTSTHWMHSYIAISMLICFLGPIPCLTENSMLHTRFSNVSSSFARTWLVTHPSEVPTILHAQLLLHFSSRFCWKRRENNNT